jgi:hypothetical protein
VADALGAQLIDRGAAHVDLLAGGLAHRHRSQVVGGLGVVAVAAVAVRLVEAGQHQHLALQVAERFQ